jgi:hypothetical protein
MVDQHNGRGILAATGVSVGSSTVVRTAAFPGDTALVLPASPAVGATCFIQNEGTTAALVFPADPGVRIDVLAPGAPKSVAAGVPRKTFTAVSSPPPYAWVWPETDGRGRPDTAVNAEDVIEWGS